MRKGNRQPLYRRYDMEVVAIMMSLAGMGLAVTMAIRDERRRQAEISALVTRTRQRLDSRRRL